MFGFWPLSASSASKIAAVPSKTETATDEVNEKQRAVSVLNLKLQESGSFTGIVRTVFNIFSTLGWYFAKTKITAPVINETTKYDDELIEALDPSFKELAKFHNHKVIGIDKLPKEGGCMIALNHTSNIEHILLFANALREKGLYPRMLVANAALMTPGLGEMIQGMGGLAASPEAGQKVLEEGGILLVCPGGIEGMIRPYSRRYTADFEGHRGFIELAMKTGKKLFLAACPAADDALPHVDNAFSRLCHQAFRFGVPVMWGQYGLPVPNQVDITHSISDPLDFGKHEFKRENKPKALITENYNKAVKSMNVEMIRALLPREKAIKA